MEFLVSEGMSEGAWPFPSKKLTRKISSGPTSVESPNSSLENEEMVSIELYSQKISKNLGICISLINKSIVIHKEDIVEDN